MECSLLYEFQLSWLEGFHSRVREEICWDTSTNLLLCWGKKSSGIFITTPEETISPVSMLGTIAALSSMLSDPWSQRETRAAWTILSTLPSSCWTRTSCGTYNNKRKTSGYSFWSSPIVPITWGATGHSCSSWAARGRVPHRTSQSPLWKRPPPAQRRLREPSTGSSVP